MKGETYQSTVVDFAWQVIEMDRELGRLTTENAELLDYRKRYFDLLNESTAHSAHMIGGLMELVMKPGVADAISAANALESEA